MLSRRIRINRMDVSIYSNDVPPLDQTFRTKVSMQVALNVNGWTLIVINTPSDVKAGVNTPVEGTF